MRNGGSVGNKLLDFRPEFRYTCSVTTNDEAREDYYRRLMAERSVGSIVYMDPETMSPLAGKPVEVMAVYKALPGNGGHVRSPHGDFIASPYVAWVRLLAEDRTPGEVPHEIVSLGGLLTPEEYDER